MIFSLINILSLKPPICKITLTKFNLLKGDIIPGVNNTNILTPIMIPSQNSTITIPIREYIFAYIYKCLYIPKVLLKPIPIPVHLCQY